MRKFSKFTILYLLFGVLLVATTNASAQICPEPFARPSYPTRQAFCRAGQLVEDAYLPGSFIRCEEVEVDHLISLRQAWESGVCGDDLKRLARDPRNLRLTYWRTNRQKGYLAPEEFVIRLPNDVAASVLRDARQLSREYRIATRDEALYRRLLKVAQRSTVHVRVPLSQLRGEIAERVAIRQVGGRTAVFIGGRAIGYAIGVGAAVEAVLVANWAVNWVATPKQTDLMRLRADSLREILSEVSE